MTEICTGIQSSFSAYLDGAITGREMQEIARHLESCGHCKHEFDGLRSMQQSLAMLGPAKAPADLGMKLRIAISHERAAMKSSWKDALGLSGRTASVHCLYRYRPVLPDRWSSLEASCFCLEWLPRLSLLWRTTSH